MAEPAVVAPSAASRQRSGKLGHVQALRAYAALVVVAYHVTLRMAQFLHHVLLHDAFGWGASGVDTFFVVSGFIIMTVHRRDIGRPQALTPYLAKRAIRIYPIYWVVTLVALVAYAGGYGTGSKLNADVIVRSFILFPQHVGLFPVVNVGWTLSYELIFYLMFALLIAFPPRVAWPIVAAWTVPCVAILVCDYAGLWHPPATIVFYVLLSPRNVEFLFGVAVALVVSRWRVPFPHVVMWVGLAVLVTLGFVEALVPGTSFMYGKEVLVAGIPSAVALLGAAQLDRRGVTPPKPLITLGDASYSLYLVHFMVITAVFEIARHLGLTATGWMWPEALAALGASIITALLCFTYVESPILRNLRRRLVPGER